MSSHECASGEAQPAPARESLDARFVRRLLVDAAFGLVLPFVCWWVNGHADFWLGSFETAFESPRAGVLGLNLGGPVAGLLWLILLGAAMAIWIVFQPGSPVLAGALTAAGAWAFCFGVVILPFSLLGLMATVGVLGFVPFGSAWVCGRAARQALREASARLGRGPALRRCCMAAVLAACLPTAAGFGSSALIERDLAAIVDGRGEVTEASWTRLAVLRPLLHAAGTDPARDVARAWLGEEKSQRRAALARAYERMTGDDVVQSRDVRDLERMQLQD